MAENLDFKDANDALVAGFEMLPHADASWKRLIRPSWRDHAFTARDLQGREYPAVRWIIPNLIPEGLSVLAGRPKIGKSWLALDIALAVAAGTACLGDVVPDQGDVLYCAMEDNERRIKNRIGKILGHDATWPDRLTITTKWKRLNEGGTIDIQEWVKTALQPRLVVLDTLATVKPLNTKEGYQQDYAALTHTHRIANDAGIGIVALHHQRKGEAEDPLDTISGTLAITGCADTSLVLSSTTAGKTLYLRGRDVEEAEHAVEFNAATCRWKILGDVDDVRRSDTRRKMIAALKESGKMGPQQIAEITGLSEAVVKNRLADLVKNGDVTKPSRGEYEYVNRR